MHTLEGLKNIAVSEGKALAICMNGKVNGKEFVCLEYDEISNHDALCLGLALQKKFNLGQFAMFRTHNGMHIRYFWDNQLTHEQVNEIIAESNTSKEYAKIAIESTCSGRVAGKHKEHDIEFVGIFGKPKITSEKERRIGDSLLTLAQTLGKIRLKKELLLND